jgi:hypothetical protein
MSESKKATSITSPSARASKRAKQVARNRSQRARIVTLDERTGRVVFDSDVSVGRSSGELAYEIADPLARAIKALKPHKGVDVIVVSDGGERKSYLVETKSPQRKAGKGQARKGTSRKASRLTDKRHLYSFGDAGESSPLKGYQLMSRSAGEIPRPSTDELAERMLPEVPVPSPAQATLAQRESQARWSMLEEFGAFTSEELADQRSQAKNRHALANRWRSEGKVFAVELRGRQLYPGFQFDPETFAPEPIVAEVLTALPREQMSDWEVALWWVASDPWLDGDRPVDLMREDPEMVTKAASALAEPSAL